MADKVSLPWTQPHHAPIFDTGPHPGPLRALGGPAPQPSAAHALDPLERFDADAFRQPISLHAEPVVVPPASADVDGKYLSVKRWQFVFIVAAVWVLAAASGIGLYFWWYTSPHKTPAVFGVLMYLIGCAVASLLVSMVPHRPPVAALAIALMSAPMASVAAAAVLYGAYYFEWIARPTIG